jgi:hypothetical protein
MSRSSFFINGKYSGFTFSANVWNKNQVGSPHFIFLAEGGTWLSDTSIAFAELIEFGTRGVSRGKLAF